MKRFLKYLLAAVILAALAALLGPVVSDQISRWRASQVIDTYRNEVDALGDEQRSAILTKARGMVAQAALLDPFSPAQASAPSDPLPDIDGVLGALEIPRLGVRLPIYRQTHWRALINGAGHVSGTSLPLGADGGHTVLAGYSDRLSARLFAGVNRLIEGDLFTIEALGERMTYQVDQVTSLPPEALEQLALEQDKDTDFCTLITAPWGREMRLLVRGRRVNTRLMAQEDEAARLPFWLNWMVFGLPVLAAGMLLLALVELILRAAQRWRLNRLKL